MSSQDGGDGVKLDSASGVDRPKVPARAIAHDKRRHLCQHRAMFVSIRVLRPDAAQVLRGR